ncbi:hypothetical protein D3C87_987820 [compost metagenome]
MAFGVAAAIALSACSASPSPAPSAPPAPTPTPKPTPDAWQFVNPDAPDRIILGSVRFWEDFETDLSRWTIDGSAGDARWLRLEGNFCGGAFTMLFGLPDRTEFASGAGLSTLTLNAPIDLAGVTRPHLTYDVRGLSYPQDAIMVQPEARRPGGEWSPVGPVTVSRYPSDMGYRAADLTPYAGGEVEIRFKAYLSSLERPTRGFMLDDVKILEPS